MKDYIDIEIREGQNYVSFYSHGKWIRGGKKCYLLALMYELTEYYSQDYPRDVKFYLAGGYENDEEIIKRRKNSV